MSGAVQTHLALKMIYFLSMGLQKPKQLGFSRVQLKSLVPHPDPFSFQTPQGDIHGITYGNSLGVEMYNWIPSAYSPKING